MPAKVLAVLKANAYGLGILPIAQALKAEEIQGFGVAEPREALAIRKLGLPVHILGGLLPSEIPCVVKEDIIAPITDIKIAQMLNAEALKQSKTVECHILIDTGMGRLGISLPDAEETIEKIMNFPGLKCIGLYSHFPHAYGDPEFSQWQLNQMADLLARLRNKKISFSWVHFANSDGINNIPSSFSKPYNLVRVGINLYGLFDLEGDCSLELEAAVTVKARLIAIRELAAEAAIGYGRTHRLNRTTLVGTVAIGYADGLPFAMSNNGNVIIRGKRCPILGRISMDYTTISVDNVPNAQVGDEVICLGQGVSVNDWAQRKNSTPYDIICSLGSRVERRYVGTARS